MIDLSWSELVEYYVGILEWDDFSTSFLSLVFGKQNRSRKGFFRRKLILGRSGKCHSTIKPKKKWPFQDELKRKEIVLWLTGCLWHIYTFIESLFYLLIFWIINILSWHLSNTLRNFYSILTLNNSFTKQRNWITVSLWLFYTNNGMEKWFRTHIWWKHYHIQFFKVSYIPSKPFFT